MYKREEALEWVQEVLSNEITDSLTLYNAACFYSMAGDIEKSLDTLSRGIDAGDRDADWWRQDGDLDNVRNDPRFDELLQRMEACN